MHYTAQLFAQKFNEVYLNKRKNLNIVDLGSYNVNGNVRKIFSKENNYIGLDLEKGPNVDIVMQNPYKIPFEDNSQDVVISTSCFEHSQMFWRTFNEIIRVLKPNGLFYLNAPSNGPYHAFPVDCYRFYPDAGEALVEWSKHSGYRNLIMLETFTGIQEKDVWNDYVSIFLKDKSFINQYNQRIINLLGKKFYNGKIYGSKNILNLSHKTEDQQYKILKYTSKTEYLIYRAINKLFRLIYNIFNFN